MDAGTLSGALVNGLGVTVMVYILLATGGRVRKRALDCWALSLGGAAAAAIMVAGTA